MLVPVYRDGAMGLGLGGGRPVSYRTPDGRGVVTAPRRIGGTWRVKIGGRVIATVTHLREARALIAKGRRQ